MRGAGILTGCPSPTAFALGLGPALPWEDKPSPGNLGFSAETILTSLYATHTDIRTSDISTAPHDAASQTYGTLPYHSRNLIRKSVASVLSLSPVTFSAHDNSTSELLRTLSRVAAYKPTSWLSRKSYFLYHLAEILGP